MNINQIKYFIEIARLRSINKASKNLYVSQSTLIDAINSLEDELGDELLIRTHKGTILTEFGQKIYDEAITVLDIIDGWYQYKKPALDRTTINLACIPSFYFTAMNDIIIEVSTKNPAIDIVPHFVFPDMLDNWSQGTLPIAITNYLPENKELVIEDLQKKGMVVEELFETRFCLYINSEYSSILPEYIMVEDLSKLNIVNTPVRPKTSSIVDLYDPQKVTYIYQQNNIFQLVATTKSCAVLPEFLKTYPEYSRMDKISTIPIRGFDSRIFLVLAYPQKNDFKEEEKLVLNTIRSYCKKLKD